MLDLVQVQSRTAAKEMLYERMQKLDPSTT